MTNKIDSKNNDLLQLSDESNSKVRIIRRPAGFTWLVAEDKKGGCCELSLALTETQVRAIIDYAEAWLEIGGKRGPYTVADAEVQYRLRLHPAQKIQLHRPTRETLLVTVENLYWCGDEGFPCVSAILEEGSIRRLAEFLKEHMPIA